MTAFSTVSLVSRDPEASVAFYRLLGLEIEDHSGAEFVHLTINGEKPGALDIDGHHLGEHYNAAVRDGTSSNVIIGFTVDSRDEVDALHATITAAGHPSRQVPYDAFWGARYGIVADPDGNDVGIMSPMDDTMRSWPPTPSPST